MRLVLQRFAATVSTWQAGDYARSRALADQLLDFATREGSDVSLRCAHEGQAWTRYSTGDFAGHEEHFRACLKICERAGYGVFPGETTVLFGVAAQCAWQLGHSDVVRERTDRSVAFGRDSVNQADIVFALSMKATTAMMQRDPLTAEAAATEAVATAEKFGLANAADLARGPLAWARAHLTKSRDSITTMRETIAALLSGGARNQAGDALLRFAHVLSVLGEPAEALATVEQFLKEYPDFIIIKANALELRGELLLKLGQTAAAEGALRDALAVAQRVGTKPIELRAATALARLLAGRGRREEASNLLTPIYGWFTDGFDTLDLIEAKAALDALGG